MLNDWKALLRQTRRSYFMMTPDFMEGEVFDGLIKTLKEANDKVLRRMTFVLKTTMG